VAASSSPLESMVAPAALPAEGPETFTINGVQVYKVDR
jgi:hypothetical protein